jgi:hypothetical protein
VKQSYFGLLADLRGERRPLADAIVEVALKTIRLTREGSLRASVSFGLPTAMSSRPNVLSRWSRPPKPGISPHRGGRRRAPPRLQNSTRASVGS